MTAIYLVPQSLTGSSRLLGTVGPTYCSSTALLRIEFTASQCSHGTGGLLPHLFTLASCLEALFPSTWDALKRSPDFPHLSVFTSQPRLSDLVAEILYSMHRKLSNRFRRMQALLLEKDKKNSSLSGICLQIIYVTAILFTRKRGLLI